MDIPPDPFPAVSLVCTSRDKADIYAVCYTTLTVGVPIPWEGAINFNMSTITSTLEESTAWPNDLGFGIANDSAVTVPCTVLINFQTQGITGSLHPNIRCFVFSGGAERPYVILQLRGFSSLIAAGSQMMIIVPDLQSCIDADLKCMVTLTSAYTTELDIPYTLNSYVTSVALIIDGSISQNVNVAGGTGITQDT
jgi:hypothetical protein